MKQYILAFYFGTFALFLSAQNDLETISDTVFVDSLIINLNATKKQLIEKPATSSRRRKSTRIREVRDGADGSRGEDAGDYDAKLWIENDTINLLLTDASQGFSRLYRSTSKGPVLVLLNGGDGVKGNAGVNGLTGRDGRYYPSTRVRSPEAGGNALNGGRGGDGGNGGTILWKIHPSALLLSDKITVESRGGKGGNGGGKGYGGKAGAPMAYQMVRNNGKDGIVGEAGKDGEQGLSGIIISEF